MPPKPRYSAASTFRPSAAQLLGVQDVHPRRDVGRVAVQVEHPRPRRRVRRGAQQPQPLARVLRPIEPDFFERRRRPQIAERPPGVEHEPRLLRDEPDHRADIADDGQACRPESARAGGLSSQRKMVPSPALGEGLTMKKQTHPNCWRCAPRAFSLATAFAGPAGRQRRAHEAAADADRQRDADRLRLRQQHLDRRARRRHGAPPHELPGADDEPALFSRRQVDRLQRRIRRQRRRLRRPGRRRRAEAAHLAPGRRQRAGLDARRQVDRLRLGPRDRRAERRAALLDGPGAGRRRAADAAAARLPGQDLARPAPTSPTA